MREVGGRGGYPSPTTTKTTSTCSRPRLDLNQNIGENRALLLRRERVVLKIVLESTR